MNKDLINRIKKASKIEFIDTLGNSEIFKNRSMVKTKVPLLNLALSGSFDGGLACGHTAIAGPSKHFKTSFALVAAAAYLDAYEDAVLIFYDTEFGSPQSYFEEFGIDTNRVIHIPITTVEQLKTDMVNQLEELKREDHVVFVIDSLGNIASKKELEDAKDDKQVADMTRAKAMKSLFRMITGNLSIKDIPLISINHTYDTMEMYSKKVVSGGCVGFGTRVKMGDGSIKEIQDIKVNDEVRTISGKQRVIDIWNPDTLANGCPPCYEVEFEDGKKIICSDIHRFLTKNGWKYVKDLTVDDELVEII